ncbi:hypothetical protein EJ08DRAFT_254252 [Tothia fuscella]|uniref:DUF7624 domain-containing protein n=1 Tax=Tothia fuscella TaxID=1048955 RepID=A0A9P4NR68_9PEZI|nr:hypothetical protein EJ08DRAFT_254252 [Tothia fuscella]
MQRASVGSDNSLHPPPSPYPATVDPSPVESNDSHSTDVTDIDADGDDDQHSERSEQDRDIEILSPASGISQEDAAPLPLPQLDTAIADKSRVDSDDAPQSVIHAPTGFRQFQEHKKSPPFLRPRSESLPSQNSENTVVSPTTPESNLMPEDKRQSTRNSATTPIDTSVPPARHGAGSTPRASTIQEAEDEWRRRSWASNKQNLEDIEEHEDQERPGSSHTTHSQASNISEALRNLSSPEQEVSSLKSALTECWTLCNTLANLSSIHRERMFSFSGSGDVQEQAWRSCWRLCQNLYESRDEDHIAQVRPTLELCREFCQALFEARHRGDEVTDSILRVSFELNNHLYNTHDRNLPDAFRERTLDFYLTMCHRLMKQHTSLPEETDALLRACWQLAELLFSLRQNNRDNKPVDEELLGSAVQACWELCDLFREGWSQIRPDRGTPKPSQRVFPGANFPNNDNYSVNSYSNNRNSNSRPASSLSGTFHTANSIHNAPPETPTTIFDDREDFSPAEMAVPNILVLGPDPTGVTSNMMSTRRDPRWSSNSSVTDSQSGYSESSQRTTKSGTRPFAATPTPQQQAIQLPNRATPTPLQQQQAQQQQQQDAEDPHLLRLKALILKAALNVGFGRNSPTTLTAFIKTLPSTAFGSQPWQLSLFEAYRKLVLTDPMLRGDQRALLPAGRRMTANEIGRAVQWMSRNETFAWFRDLFLLVFGFDANEAPGKKGVGIQV